MWDEDIIKDGERKTTFVLLSRRAKGARPMEQLAKRGGGTASTVSF